MQIVGTLSEVTLSDVARMLAQVRQTGTMVVHTTPVRWVSFVAGAIDLVEREDGVVRYRVEAWQKTRDPAEQFRVRKDRLMELILLDGCRADFEFTSGDVEESGLPPFDLTELENRALLTGCPDQHTWPQPVLHSATRSAPRQGSLRPTLPPTVQQRAAHGVPSLSASVLAVPRPREAEPEDDAAASHAPEPAWAVPPPAATPASVPAAHDPARTRQRALSRLISAVRSR